MSQNAMHLSWRAEEVDQRLHQIMHAIHDQCVKYGTQPDGYINYVRGVCLVRQLWDKADNALNRARQCVDSLDRPLWDKQRGEGGGEARGAWGLRLLRRNEEGERKKV